MKKFRTVIISLIIEELIVLKEEGENITYLDKFNELRVERIKSHTHAWHLSLKDAQDYIIDNLKNRIIFSEKNIITLKARLEEALKLYSRNK